ncbi:hypothetical protein [Nocardiopsis sp. NRRL B-16309]|uniref:hypothetical protein n=1 Tax=Nocardiopsis sp. NRRL B-16309 TaxID=1519494 RepID=UPI0009EB9116|nr:hypothetical protein [Nocardiopsis sp. NRRL B-16309]
MPYVEVSQDTDRQLALLARWEKSSKGEVIARLLTRLTVAEEPSGSANEDARVPVYARYKKQRVEGWFDPATRRLGIVSPPWDGHVFDDPSPAAGAVVERANSLLPRGERVSTSRNGWVFWRVAATGEKIETLRTAKPADQRS